MTEQATRPATKNARHQLIVDLVSTHEIKSQTELADLLAGRERLLLRKVQLGHQCAELPRLAQLVL